MASTRKNGKIKDYKESIRDRIIDIQEKDIKEAKELSKKTSPGFASMWTGVPKDVITGDANKVDEQKAADRAHMQKRRRELFDVDNGYLAKANKEYARKLHGFSEKEVRAILAFRTKENEKRVKNNEPGI